MLKCFSRALYAAGRLTSKTAPISSTCRGLEQLRPALIAPCPPAVWPFTRTIWMLCSSGSTAGPRQGLLGSTRGTPHLSCGCGGLHTEGDKAFAEFLSDEIKEERKIQKHKSLPKMSGGWELELNGTEAKIVRHVGGEKISVSFNINNSIPPSFDEEETQDSQKNPDNEPEIVSTPNFVVEVTKQATNQSLVFDCHFPEDEVGHGEEEEESDIFTIREVSFQPTGESDWKETSYTLTTDSLDWALYDHLMDFLADRGVDNTFADELVELSTALEHQEYIKFLEELNRFVKCN
ncbi:complement component 1 Q subcomponent-binding protein, mitochondrial [Erpetoichthys calabaricus]|uniref:Complement component 1 Q subcomponent-binding protein, mitochondrial n=1 Tax=Erpetoichthys calabaricus TaxID=27687 RepID=A0A8C4T774_ERPCA|nr:complement component 1 Q subcomponent-binding protein, mitochondrial [Erpetoichthys calabaricus]